MRLFALTILAAALALPAPAADDLAPGTAKGTLIIGEKAIPLAYAYAIDRQKNENTNRRDDVRVVITDKPLPEKIDLNAVDYAFPDGTYGLVVCLDRDGNPSHVVIQHPEGMYDAGYFSGVDDYRWKGSTRGGRVDGRLSSKMVATSTMKFAFDVRVNAPIR